MKTIEVGDLLRLHGGRIDRVVKVIAQTPCEHERYNTIELFPSAGNQPQKSLVYGRKKRNGIFDAVRIGNANESFLIERLSNVICYDNDGRTADRYTVIYRDQAYCDDGSFECIGMCATPFLPNGISMHGLAVPGSHIGKEIDFNELPADCQKKVLNDLYEQHEAEIESL